MVEGKSGLEDLSLALQESQLRMNSWRCERSSLPNFLVSSLWFRFIIGCHDSCYR